jgi:cellulose synthase/poly-beta-1,6-N-acetylglucosamine synthase-like glycosyltransferase
MQLLKDIASFLEILLFIYLGGNALYIFVFGFAGMISNEGKGGGFSRYRKLSILITAYKEDQIIEAIVRSALQQDYPAEKIELILIADSFGQSTIEALKPYPIKLVIADFEVSTKVHSLQLSLRYLDPETEFVFILDADNVMERDCLRKLNMAFDRGFQVIQCHRSAKNTDTSFAVLDAISEEVNNTIFRKGHRALGLSAALIGSAMAFDINVFRRYIPDLKAVGGFDKELELLLLKSGIVIDYLPDAYVYDEKVSSSKAFYSQRRRWISAQLLYFGKGIAEGIRSLVSTGNIDFFNKTIQFALFPRVMLLGMLFMINAVYLFFPGGWIKAGWLVAFLLCALAILFSVPYHFFNRKTLKAVFSLPSAFLIMLSVFFRLRKANKTFIHTQHSYHSNL